jgi:hypothetical protein
MTESLDARLAALTSEVDRLRRAVESLPTAQASVDSAIEAALVLSRAARVVESYVAALAPPVAGEIVVTARDDEADSVVGALVGWNVVARHVEGATVVLRARRP